MKTKRANYYAKNYEQIEQRDRIFLRNPVFITGLALAPVVVAATTLNNAVILGTAVLLLLLPTRVIASLVSRVVLYRFCSIVYALTSAGVYVGVYILMRYLFGVGIQSVGIYLPLLVLDFIIIKRYEKPTKEKLSTAFVKGILTTIGFELALFLVAAIREFLAFGTLYGIKVIDGAPMPIAALTSGGFMIVGVLAALWRAVIARFRQDVYEGVEQDGVA